MARRRGAPTGRCQGCNHPERVRIERFLAAGASIMGAARNFAIDYHALRRHWRNHVSAEARATYVAGGGATKDQLEAIVADESLALVDHYRMFAVGFTKALPRLPSWETAIPWRCYRGGCTRISGIAGD
jgi:hypothetical protein